MGLSGVVITGLGVISPLGLTRIEMWEGLCAGRCGISKIKAFDPVGFPCQLAGEVPDYEIRSFLPKSYRKAVKLMSRDIELAVVAAHEAVASSGLVTKGIDPKRVNVEPERMAINLGAGLISCNLVEIAPAVAASLEKGRFDIHKWGREGMELVTPLWMLKYLPNMPACHVGIIHDIQGPSNTIMCAEASGNLAIGEAAEVIARGSSDIALAGGVEAKVNPLVILRQCLLGRSATKYNDEPDRASRPFDRAADGSVFGEAAALVVLERQQRARQRGAKIYAEVIGVGHGNNISAAYERLEPDGLGIQVAVEMAMAEAHVQPEQLDLIIPHGTGIAADDRAEAAALEAVLGPAVRDICVWPIKSMVSNTGAAGGALDVVAAACAMDAGLIPAARNWEEAAEGCHLNIVAETQQRQVNYALCCSYTYGGQTAALVLKKFDGAADG